MNKAESNKAKRAIGLRYNQSDDRAPQVIAKGFDNLAEEIIAIARDNGILIHEDPHLSEFLARLDLGQNIPESLYYVIAELIAFSYLLQGKTPDGWEAPPGYFTEST